MNEIEEHDLKYEQFLQAGANADTESERNQYAQKAEYEANRYKAKQKRQKNNRIKIGIIVVIDAMREVLALQTVEPFVNPPRREIGKEEFQSKLIDAMKDNGLEIDDIKNVEEALDIYILDHDLDASFPDKLENILKNEDQETNDDQIEINVEEDVEINEEETHSELDSSR